MGRQLQSALTKEVELVKHDELVAELQSSAGMKTPHAKTLKKAWRALAE